jgi:hypothetical protein
VTCRRHWTWVWERGSIVGWIGAAVNFSECNWTHKHHASSYAPDIVLFAANPCVIQEIDEYGIKQPNL